MRSLFLTLKECLLYNKGNISQFHLRYFLQQEKRASLFSKTKGINRIMYIFANVFSYISSYQKFGISSFILLIILLLHHMYKWLLSNLLAKGMFQVWWFRKHQSLPRRVVFQTAHSMCKLYCSEKRVYHGKIHYWLQWINIVVSNVDRDATGNPFPKVPGRFLPPRSPVISI